MASEAQKRASLKWDKENATVFSCKVKNEVAVAFKGYCQTRDKTPAAVLREYVEDCTGMTNSAKKK